MPGSASTLKDTHTSSTIYSRSQDSGSNLVCGEEKVRYAAANNYGSVDASSIPAGHIQGNRVLVKETSNIYNSSSAHELY